MAEVASGRNSVAHELLEFFRLGESTGGGSRKDRLAVQANFKDAAFAGPESDFAKVLPEGREQLLGHPGRTRQPATLGAVGDLDTRSFRLRTHPPDDTPCLKRLELSNTEGNVPFVHFSAIVALHSSSEWEGAG